MDSITSTIAAFPQAVAPATLLFSVAGLVLGLVWGALPALSTTMAMALLIGFSSGLSLDHAIAFILAVYVGSVAGGSVAAICVNIPGTPAAACTAREGYPLFRKGDGGRALGTALVASTIGNLAGAVLLILLVPHTIAMAMSVGSWEVFLLGMWGRSAERLDLGCTTHQGMARRNDGACDLVHRPRPDDG